MSVAEKNQNKTKESLLIALLKYILVNVKVDEVSNIHMCLGVCVVSFRTNLWVYLYNIKIKTGSS